MENKRIHIIQFCLFLALCSCTGQLELSPITDKEAGNFFKTEQEMEEAVNGTYASLQFTGLYNLYLPVLGEIPSDNTFDEVPANDEGNYGQLDEFTVITSNSIITRTWKDSYISIQRANTVLHRLPNVVYADQSTKESRKGEMYFIRALNYFNLVRIYGDVPLVTEETENPASFFGKGRNATSAVYEQIIADLKNAIVALPLKALAPGRVSRGAAQALLGKVYLTLGNWANAESYLLEVLNSGEYQLLEDLSDIFSESQENNQEIIFSVQFTQAINGNTEGSDAFQQFSPSGTINGAKGHNLPTRALYALMSDSDKRKSAYLGVTSEGVPFNKKYQKPSSAPNDGGGNWVVLRYADVLLMLAEIENELGNTAQAINYLNRIRERAGLSDIQPQEQSKLRETVAQERRFELIGEGHRWFDLLRYGTAIETMNAYFKNQKINISIQENNLLMPVPQSQIDTDPAIAQNPGY
ncbi:RagB/SusD family nutrient uptake outer membrane protein [Marinilongibacter aquaticus]|uniref:RagB/SusD family nutrient uptake outer membrane protein n=1 Tax=Marinilongibacter aquaticus TaxID=2975157 RepID=UPI0021BD3486|nr:RagB/SusD family nutrient uptake outer membrane protein [Marinilongibacter aquaticus]UBM58618.1 RagB/SusD family nutrient uptake outer membrane protein [Marinilongibacter aquaticus]